MKWLLAAAFCALPVRAASTIAVLPFANASAPSVPNAGNFAWIGESIAETVREALGGRGVAIVPREDVMDAYGELRLRPLAELTRGSAIKLGQELQADQVLYGTFRFEPRKPSDAAETMGHLTVRARLSSARELTQSPWIEDIGPLEELGTVEAHLAWRVLALVAPQLAPAEAEFQSLRPPARLDAQENYIRGLLAEAPDQKEKFFIQAAALDSRFWRPAFQLGKIHLARKQYREAADWLARVDPSDMHYGDAQFSLGVAKFHSADYAAAQQAFEIASQRAPSAEAFNNLGAAESRRGAAHAVESFSRALEAKPTDPDYHFNLGYALWKGGQFEAAADRFRAALDRDPADQMATLLLGRCLKKEGLRKGAPGDARLAALERLKPVDDGSGPAPAR
jgi:tetratricopeptide (TPR) repeat protein